MSRIRLRVAVLAGLMVCAQAPAENRWEPQIRKFEEQDAQDPPPKRAILFVGSSTIALWNTRKCFADLVHLNRGFGGSRVEDSLYFADRIILPYEPATIVFYAGDNDIAAGETPEQVRDEFLALYDKVYAALPKTRVLFLSIKPSPIRMKFWPAATRANELIRDARSDERPFEYVALEPILLGEDGQPKAKLYRADRLHLNEDGYRALTDLVKPLLAKGAGGGQ
ncbi:MAG: hypothetical protein HYU66_10500 [Armatimonadetes bacterium]|nr:hypothetical protein [Armatimonadota bacterium]